MPLGCVMIASRTPAHLERVAMLLVVEDVAPGERRLREVIRQRLLFQRQRRELIRIELHDGRVVHAFEQIFPLCPPGRLCPLAWRAPRTWVRPRVNMRSPP